MTPLVTAPPPERRQPAAAAPTPARAGYGRRFWLFAAAALGLHAAFIFGVNRGTFVQPEFAMTGELEAIEVELVAGEPEAVGEPEPEPTPEPPAEPEPVIPVVPPEPLPEPLPEPPPPTPDEMSEPEPAKPKPEPRPKPKPAPPRPQPAAPRPAAVTARPTAQAPGVMGGGATGATTGSTGKPRGSTKPGYLSNPRPAYPSESRRLREQGVVLLRVMVNAQGRPDSVSVQRSSGFARLDAAAAEGVRRWRFKPGTQDGAAVAGPVTVPVRFNLAD